jgi:hypothetical protein
MTQKKPITKQKRKQRRIEIISSRACNYAKEMKENPIRNLFFILGFGFMLGIFFIVIYFIGERVGLFPVLSLFELGFLTDAENSILFILLFFLIIMMGTLLIGVLLYHLFKHQCKTGSK